MVWGAVCASVAIFGSLLVESSLIFYLVGLRGQSVGSLGLVFGALGVGSLAGAWISPRLIERLGSGRLVVLATVAQGVVTGGLLVLPGLGGVVAVWAANGLCSMLFIVGWYTLRQQVTPPELLGRVIALTRVLAFLPLPVAPIVAGALLGATGSFPVVVALSVLLQVAAGVAAWCTPLRSAGRQRSPAPR
jgi:MFS family permease